MERLVMTWPDDSSVPVDWIEDEVYEKGGSALTRREKMTDLHKRLVDRQSTKELRRKSEKAASRKCKLWTQEELDYIDRCASEISKELKFDE